MGTPFVIRHSSFVISFKPTTGHDYSRAEGPGVGGGVDCVVAVDVTTQEQELAHPRNGGERVQLTRRAGWTAVRVSSPKE
ncbi:MAG: hypothetical protein ACYC4U_17240 [Pirellulaceae bacterium]